MKRNYLNIALFLSLLSIGVTIIINIKIAQRYISATGKTRALFGLTELLNFGYQYYIAILGMVVLMLSILSVKTNEQRNKKRIAVLLSVVAIALVFVRMWRLFV